MKRVSSIQPINFKKNRYSTGVHNPIFAFDAPINFEGNRSASDREEAMYYQRLSELHHAGIQTKPYEELMKKQGKTGERVELSSPFDAMKLFAKTSASIPVHSDGKPAYGSAPISIRDAHGLVYQTLQGMQKWNEDLQKWMAEETERKQAILNALNENVAFNKEVRDFFTQREWAQAFPPTGAAQISVRPLNVAPQSNPEAQVEADKQEQKKTEGQVAAIMKKDAPPGTDITPPQVKAAQGLARPVDAASIQELRGYPGLSPDTNTLYAKPDLPVEPLNIPGLPNATQHPVTVKQEPGTQTSKKQTGKGKNQPSKPVTIGTSVYTHVNPRAEHIKLLIGPIKKTHPRPTEAQLITQFTLWGYNEDEISDLLDLVANPKYTGAGWKF